MRYGRTLDGQCWHILVEGKALCCSTFTLLEERDSLEFPRSDVCQNCDSRMRDRGRELRKLVTQGAKRVRPKTSDYKPRYKFKE